jgi:molybdate transport system regulatory protein
MSNTTAPGTAAAPLELVGSVWLRSGDQNWGSQRRFALLAAIGAEGSISAAAKKVGLSYKAAWDAVDAMNNLAGEPLVLRVTGGQRGGGARLTARAVELIELYRDVSREHERFMAQLAKVNTRSAHNLELIQNMMMQTSARNKLAGVVEQIKPGAVNSEVILGIGHDRHIVASITEESVRNLELRVGRRALAFIKASSVMVGLPGEGLELSARNQLQGHVNRIVRGTVSAEVCIEIAQGSVIAAVISDESVNVLMLKEGDSAIAIFKASSVMLGVFD